MQQFLRQALRIAQVIFALSLIYFALRLLLYHYHLLVFPYADSFREGAMMTSTDALLKNLNPYDMSLQPRFMNQYGIIYPLLIWPWAKLFGNTILVHRTVVAFSILGSCLLIFFVLKKARVPVLLNIWAVLMLYSSLLFPGTSTPTIDPGATGMFFFLLTVFIPWFYEYSYPSLIISIVCGLLSFYTKSYTFLGVFIMLSYVFLFVSKIKGLFYTFLLLILSVISTIAVNQTFQAYFDNCFFSHVNMEHAWASMERLHEQLVQYRYLHRWTLILIGIYALGYGFKYLRHKRPFKLSFPLVLYAGMCSSFVLYMSLGRHSGAMLWYFFQLLSPFFLVAAAWVFGRYAYWPLLGVPFLVLNLYVMTAPHDYKIFDKPIPIWSQVSKVISEHHRILNSPLIASLLIEQKKEVFDNGQTEYFGAGGDRSSWMKSLFKKDDRVPLQLTLYFYNIRKMVQNKEFDLIILQPSLLPGGVADDVRNNYKFEGQLLLYAPQDHRYYPLTFWVLR